MRSYFKKFFLAALLVALGGCGMWNNFTTYFNTYYNTNKLFNEAMEEIKEQEDRFEFKVPRLQGAVQQKLTKVIEKASKILQFHSNSDFFDDALYIIGRAFYYQGEFPKAQRKFGELAALEGGKFKIEAKLWTGKTELQLREFESGLEKVNAVKDTAIVLNDREILREAYVELIAFYIYRENYDLAVELGNELLAVVEDQELAAATSFKLGELYEIIGDTEKAAEAFAKVRDYEPSFETEFKAQLENAKLQIDLGNLDQSLELLEDLRNEDKNKENFDQIELEMAKIYMEKGENKEALRRFFEIDTTYKTSESAGIASYYLGRIWEKEYAEFDSAYKYYDKAAMMQLPEEIKKEAQSKREIFRRYGNLKNDLVDYKKQYTYLTDPEEFKFDSLKYEEYIKEKTVEDSVALAEQATGNETAEELQNLNQAKKEDEIQKPVMPTVSADSVMNALAKTRFDLGNLFLTELNSPDSAFVYYNRIIEEHDSISFRPKLLYALGTYYESAGSPGRADSLYNIVYNDFKFSDVAGEAARKLGKTQVVRESDPAKKQFRSAEDLYFEEKYDSAIARYFNVYENYPRSDVAAKSLYAIGYILENDLGASDSAAAIYDTLVMKYPATEYARKTVTRETFYKNETRRLADSVQAAKQRTAD